MADVGCAGILVADTFCGPIARIPRAGELLVIDSMPSRAGGCAANVAIDLAKQGIDVDVVGCVGEDSSARFVLDSLKGQGVNCSRVISSSKDPTSRTVILLVDGEDRRYIHLFGANGAFGVKHISRGWAAGLKVFYLGGLLAMPGIDLAELAELLKFCRQNGVVVVVDVVVPPDFRQIDQLAALLPHIDFFLPNDDEARYLTGEVVPLDQARALVALGAHTVIVTCGPDGCVATNGHQFWKSPAYSMQCVDPSGAGDAFVSGIIASILAGRDMTESLRYAAAMGGSATRQVGTTDGVFTAAEAAAYLAHHPLEISQGFLPAQGST